MLVANIKIEKPLNHQRRLGLETAMSFASSECRREGVHAQADLTQQ